MNLACVQLSKKIYWRLSLDSPKSFAFSPGSNWRLANPLLNHALSGSDPVESTFLIYAPNAAWVSSRNLAFIRENDSCTGWNDEQFQELSSCLGPFLRKLRHLSGQAGMPKGEDLIAIY